MTGPRRDERRPRHETAAHRTTQLPLSLDGDLRRGLRRATVNADPWWFDGALRAIQQHADTRFAFHAGHIRDAVGDPERPCQMGSAFSLARRLGLIRPVGFITSTRTPRAGGVLRMWVGIDPVGADQ